MLKLGGRLGVTEMKKIIDELGVDQTAFDEQGPDRRTGGLG